MFHVKHSPYHLGYYPHYQLPITGGGLNNVKKCRTVSSEKFPKKSTNKINTPHYYYKIKKFFPKKFC